MVYFIYVTTSFAGIVALIKQLAPELSPLEIKNLLVDTSISLDRGNLVQVDSALDKVKDYLPNS